MLKVASIIGTRPDALKMAPVIQELARQPDRVRQVVISTGQHREMLQQVLDVFNLKPDYNLDVMVPGQSLGQITARVLERIDPVLAEIKPDVLLAQGDTTTTFVASLAAFYHRIPVGHVEAGLRTENRYDPFPEEINRRLTAVISTLHFAPTEQSADNLRREGVPEDSIFCVGNTVIDALLEVAARPYRFEDPELDARTSGTGRVLLVTAHRRENWGEPLRRICEGIRRTLTQFTDVQCVFQLHKNPLVRDVVRAELGNHPQVLLVEPQEYVPWVNLMKRATVILTDSGGIQEEAPALGKPVLVTRETTERPEGVSAGTARLVGTDPAAIQQSIARLLEDRVVYEAMSRAVNPYGDGRSAARIVSVLQSRLDRELNPAG